MIYSTSTGNVADVLLFDDGSYVSDWKSTPLKEDVAELEQAIADTRCRAELDAAAELARQERESFHPRRRDSRQACDALWQAQVRDLTAQRDRWYRNFWWAVLIPSTLGLGYLAFRLAVFGLGSML